jgi:phospholipid/cholesterol/gamma-HCH transport system substrate-binding protein
VPSQKQLKWSQLKVGLTVVAGSIILAVLILLMTSTGGMFTRKLELECYFDNASGLQPGSVVRLQGVDIGSVSKIRVVSDPAHQLTPVEVVMKVSTKFHPNLRQDSVATLATAGVLGAVYVDIDSSQAKGREARDGDVLPTKETPQIEDVVRASQTTLQNFDALEKRVDRILTFVESGRGSFGKFIYDPSLYNELNSTVVQLQNLVADVANGKGSIGKAIVSDELYRNANDTITKLNLIIDDLNAGKGTAGKFLKDPTLYNNFNQTAANAKKLTDDIDAGKGPLGVLARDQEFAAKMKDILQNVSAISDRLNSGQGTVGKLLQDEAVYNNLDQLLIESRDLIKAVRQNPKKYLTIHLKIF